MKTTSLLAFAFLGALARAIETDSTQSEANVDPDEQFEQEEIVLDAISKFASDDKIVSYVHHLGTPAMHPELQDECERTLNLCSPEGKKVLKNLGHHIRAKNNQPIIGVLTQPLPAEWNNDLELTFKSFFEASHADFLQAGGARVVPIDYTLPAPVLRRELASLNGIYIPGDSKDSYDDSLHMNAVKQILAFVSEENGKEDKHYPVMGVSYGMLSILKSQTTQSSLFRGLRSNLVGESLQQNLNLLPKETFLYDELMGWDLEKTLDDITFYNEVDEGIRLDDFKTAQQLRYFVPVATYDQGRKSDSQLEETVSTIEGTYLPIFGFGYRLDKVQFGVHAQSGEAHEKMDHSRGAIEHAQHISNLFVDEARLSPNRFEFTDDEAAKQIANHDIRMVTLPTPHDFATEKNFSRDYRTEVYLF